MIVRTLNSNDRDVRRRTGKAGAGAREGASTSSVASTAPVQKSPFEEILDEVLPAERTGATGDLHSLWKSLPDAERELMNHPSNANLYRYRDIVIAIARETLRRNTRVKKLRRRNRHGDVIELSVVEFVDERLQKMANLMHAPGNSAFLMLKTVEEIRGALLDVRE